MPRIRPLLILALAAALAGVGPAIAAPEGGTTLAAAVRQDAGLAPVASDAQAAAQAQDLAGRTGQDAATLQAVLRADASSQVFRCVACRGWSEREDGMLTRELLAPAHAEALERDPEALSALLDPRLVGVAEAPGPAGSLALVVVVDPDLALRAVSWPARVEAAKAGRIAVLVPARSASAGFSLRGAGDRLVSGRDFAVSPESGAPGATLLRMAWPAAAPGLAYGVVYRLRAGGADLGTVWVEASPPPGAVRIAGLPARSRRIVMRALESAPAPVRGIWRVLGSRLVLTSGNGTCGPMTSCTDRVGSRFRIALSPGHQRQGARTLGFVFLHELGHVADQAGISPQARRSLQLAMRATGRWRCVIDPALVDPDSPPSQWCVPDAEQFADDFARYATGSPRSDDAYGPRALIGPGRMRDLLRHRWALRPPVGWDWSWSGPGRRQP